MTTPKKLVHWALDMSFSGFGSPFSEASSEATSTSSLQYINSQLIAHGFTHSPGLSLDGLSKDDSDRLIKCLLGMLSQRIDDMSRTEDLSTKLRTLSYDHERMVSMYRAATERGSNAEREANVHKSRLASVTKTLQTTESAHKQTIAELQRTRTTMQAIRSAHQAEIKKLEKEKDRMADRWNKIADAQVKLGTAASGMRCANAEVVDAADMQMRGKGQGFLELALEQAEQARKDLFDQNRKLRGLILSTANDLQGVLHAARNITSPDSMEQPTFFTLATLFMQSPAEGAGDKLSSLVVSVRESIMQLSNSSGTEPNPASSSSAAGPSSDRKPKDVDTEVARLQAVVETLRKELEEAQKQASTYATQVQELFDRFAADERLLQGEVGEVSVDLMTVPARDEERQRLDARFKELEDERKKFTEAAVRLGREKAALEAERIKFLEEKRSWQVEMILADLPPTPAPSAAAALVDPVPQDDAEIVPPLSPRRCPRKSPSKPRMPSIAVGKAGSGKKTRHSRRSSGFGAGLGLISPKKVIPSFETEVIPSPSMQVPSFITSIAILEPQPYVTAPAFILPPPSPAASLEQGSRMTSSLLAPLPPAFAIPQTQSAPSIGELASDEPADAVSSQRPMSAATSTSAPELASASQPLAVPSTPVVRRPFPMAKPLATPHMRHAYSPVKPSPLSRILMLANSPESPELERPRLEALKEDEEESLDVSPTPAAPAAISLAPAQSLSAELGLSEDDENPLQEKTVEPYRVKAKATKSTTRPLAKEKGKTKAVPAPVSRTRPAAALEKENVKRAKLASSSSSITGASSQATNDKKSVRAPPKPFSRFKTSGKPPPGRGGARRVPIDSAEAAPVGPAWKS